MIDRLINWCKENIGKEFISPRIKAFNKGKKPQNFKIIEVNDKEQKIKIQFMNSFTILPLEFWRFKLAIELLEKQNDFVWLGTRFYSEGNNLESHIQKMAKQIYGRNTDTKTASHIADILVLSEIAEYGWTISQNGREVQGIKIKR